MDTFDKIVIIIVLIVCLIMSAMAFLGAATVDDEYRKLQLRVVVLETKAEIYHPACVL